MNIDYKRDGEGLKNGRAYDIIVNVDKDNINSDPFSRPVIDNYCSENEAKVYLTREDIKELGFLRTNPTRKISQHTNNPNLYLEEIFERDYSVKDIIVERIEVYIKTRFVNSLKQVLYSSTKPNKEDIQRVIDNYAG